MDAAVATLGRIETELTNGNVDHQNIARTLIDAMQALKRIEAKLPTPPTTAPASQPAIEVKEFKPKTKGDDDEAAQLPISA